MRAPQYVVVQTVTTAAGPDLYVTPATDHESAVRIRNGVLESAAEVFAPGSTNTIRVMTVDEWARLEAAALGLADALVGPDDEGKQS